MEVDTRSATAGWSAGVTAQIQERVRDAHSSRTSCRVVGGASWLHAGRPVTASETLSLAAHSGVVDYVPGDLTITVRSGTTLADLERTTREHGQWFPIDPFGSSSGTIGATVATGSSGPLSHGFGTIRDLVLGVEIVTGEGKIVRGGGRVVKNVAGFDLVRLVTGSWGTLGVITEITLRLYALRAPPVTFAIDAPTDTRRLAEQLSAILAAPLSPFSLELVNAELAHQLGLSPRPTILLQLGGNSAAVSAQRDSLARVAGANEVNQNVWERLRLVEPKDATVFRMSGLPAQLADRWEKVRVVTGDTEGALMHASVGRGTVRCILPSEPSGALIAQLSAPNVGDTVIFETLPRSLWSVLAPTAIGDRVSTDVRRAFDPAGVLNPGILGPVQ